MIAKIAAAAAITGATATAITAGTTASVEMALEIATSTAAVLMAAAAAAKQHHWHRLAANRNSPGTPCCRARSSARIGTGMWPSGRP